MFLLYFCFRYHVVFVSHAWNLCACMCVTCQLSAPSKDPCCIIFRLPSSSMHHPASVIDKIFADLCLTIDTTVNHNPAIPDKIARSMVQVKTEDHQLLNPRKPRREPAGHGDR